LIETPITQIAAYRRPTGVQAVIFDLDGVLINSVPAVTSSLSHVLGSYGLALSDIGTDHRSLSIKLVLAGIKRFRGISIDPVEFEAALVPEIVRTLAGESADPALTELLTRLKRENVRLGLASSSTGQSLDGKLAILGIRSYFDVIVPAEDVPSHKPAPDIYLQAIERLQRPAGRSVAIEDTAAGIASATMAGLRTIYFSKFTDDKMALNTASMHIKDWSELSLDGLQSLLTDGPKAEL
jgi:HAD superfamily hydrolase (TIGR01509 family)